MSVPDGVTGDVPATTEAFWSRLQDALEQVTVEQRTPPPGARIGAVLVLVEDGPDGQRLVLTRRRPDLRSHPGQLSFPGGRVEPGEDLVAAALREAVEEVGLTPDSIEVLGIGPTFYVPPSRFWVAPVVARWRAPHVLQPDAREVAEVLRVELDTLRDQRRWRQTRLAVRGRAAWAWQLDDDLLWGATALVVRLLLDVTHPGWAGGRSPEELGPERVAAPWLDAPRAPRRARLGPTTVERSQDSVPHVTPEQVRAVRAWLDAHGVGPLVRAEHAGRGLAEAARRMLAQRGAGQAGPLTVLAGPSSNGAGGLAAARLLTSAGLEVIVVTVGPPRFSAQTHVLRDVGVRIIPLELHPLDDETRPGVLVLDAMLGIGTRPPIAGRPAAVISWMRRHDVPVISLDVPTGLGASEGLDGPCMTADATVALGLPVVATGLSSAQAFLGDLHLADLGIPPEAWRAAGVEGVPDDLFADGPLVRLTAAAVAGDAGTPLQTELD
jgi:hydroxyethylthiazole kinase-like uncharacterized protein yjeF